MKPHASLQLLLQLPKKQLAILLAQLADMKEVM